METTWNKNQKNQPYDNSWYTELGLGLKAIAVTAPVCPRKTEIGSPSGKRHWNKPEGIRQSMIIKQETLDCLKGKEAYNSNDAVIWRGCHQSIVRTHSQVSNITLSSKNETFEIIKATKKQIMHECQ